MPLNYEDDANVEDEGMIGKLLNDSRKNQKDTNISFEEIKKRIDENKKEINENQKEIRKEFNEKIDTIEKKVEANQNKTEKRIDDLS